MVRFKFQPYWIAAFFLAWIFLTPQVWSVYFNQNYVYPKRCLVEFIVAFVALAFVFERKIIFPTKSFIVLTASLVGIKIFTTFINFNTLSVISLTEVFSFGILCLYFMAIWDRYNFKIQNFFWIISLSTFAIVATASYQFITRRLMLGVVNPVVYSAFFGNINMMAEYLVLLLPLLLLLFRTHTGWRSFFLQVILTAWLALALLSLSRSTWLAVAICFAYNLYQRISWREAVSWAIAAVILIAVQMAPVPTTSEDFGKAKEVSFSKRNELYKGSMRMLADTPLGIGGGGFEYNYTPYQMSTLEKPSESVGWDFPHSEPLKWGIENGWLYLLVVGIWWLWLAIQIWKISADKEWQTFYRTSYLVMGPQVLFQFPFENAASSLVLALVFALTFLAIKIPKKIEMKLWMRALLAVFAVIFLVKAVGRTSARWIESQHFDNKSDLEIGCQLDPTNWRVCFYYGIMVVNSPFYNDVLPSTLMQLRDRAFNYHALRVLAAYFYRKGDLAKSCDVALEYDYIFSGKSMFTAFVKEQCGPYRIPVEFINSEQFNHDYRRWISGYL